LVVTPVAYSLFDDAGATEAWRSLATRIYAIAHPFRKRVRSIVSGPSVNAEIDSIGREMEATAKSDEKMKVGAGD
jgi:hypothetical protein